MSLKHYHLSMYGIVCHPITTRGLEHSHAPLGCACLILSTTHIKIMHTCVLS